MLCNIWGIFSWNFLLTLSHFHSDFQNKSSEILNWCSRKNLCLWTTTIFIHLWVTFAFGWLIVLVAVVWTNISASSFLSVDFYSRCCKSHFGVSFHSFATFDPSSSGRPGCGRVPLLTPWAECFQRWMKKWSADFTTWPNHAMMEKYCWRIHTWIIEALWC